MKDPLDKVLAERHIVEPALLPRRERQQRECVWQRPPGGFCTTCCGETCLRRFSVAFHAYYILSHGINPMKANSFIRLDTNDKNSQALPPLS
jgi:hypothetical protein